MRKILSTMIVSLLFVQAGFAGQQVNLNSIHTLDEVSTCLILTQPALSIMPLSEVQQTIFRFNHSYHKCGECIANGKPGIKIVYPKQGVFCVTSSCG